MNKYFLALLLFITLIGNIHCQVRLDNEEQIKGYKLVNNELTFLHVNSSLLLTGEYLYYKVYCLDEKTKNYSNTSKIVYVELVGSNHVSVFKQKIRLIEGQGDGNFFIPVTIPTGSYKLIAYTNWMKNSAANNYYEQEIHVINPYIKTRLTTIKKDESQKRVGENHFPIAFSSIIPQEQLEESINIYLKSEKFPTRSKVLIDLEAVNSNINGRYSISVRKSSEMTEPNSMNSVRFIRTYKKETSENSDIGDLIYLPEVRGELIAGKIAAINHTKGVGFLDVAISIPGDTFFFQIVRTNSKGYFFINIDSDYSGTEMLMQVIGEDKYKVELDDHEHVNYANLVFEELELTENMEKEIRERSIHNQIESAYFKFKPDSVLPLNPKKQLFSYLKGVSYKLDEYKRFNTLQETILEIIPKVFVRKSKNEGHTIFINGLNSNSKRAPLILVDGFISQNHNELAKFNAHTIDEVVVYREEIVYGTAIYRGAIVITTKNNNYKNLIDSEVSEFTLFKPQIRKKYFNQKHSDNFNNNHIPDDRIQLLWNPNMIIENTHTYLDFYTSDVKGRFEIRIEGFSDEGNPITIKKYFEVE